MSISVFPIPSSDTASAYSITISTANTLTRDSVNLEPGIYRVSCVSSSVSTVDFMAGDEFIVRGATSSGVVDVNLASAADNIRAYTDTGTDIIVTITYVADALTNDFSGTLDTVTSSGTYTGTSTSGYAYALLVGAGGGGASRTSASNSAGGGAGGGIAGKIVALTGSMSVTIGALGAGAVGGEANGSNGGNSSFAGMTANGGSGGSWTSGDRAAGGTASGGTYNYTGGLGGSPTARPGLTGTNSPYPFVKSGSTGGGGGTLNSSNLGSGTSTFDGSSGGAKNNNQPAADATGYGGGGGANIGTTVGGGNGSAGVLYILKY